MHEIYKKRFNRKREVKYFKKSFKSEINNILCLINVRKGNNELLLQFLAIIIGWIDSHDQDIWSNFS